MQVNLSRSLFEGAVGAVIGATVGSFLGTTAAVAGATSALFGVAWIIKDLARQILEYLCKHKDAFSPQANVFRLVFEGAFPTAVAISHFALHLFSAPVVGVVWGIFAIEAAVIAANSRNARLGLI